MGKALAYQAKLSDVILLIIILLIPVTSWAQPHIEDKNSTQATTQTKSTPPALGEPLKLLNDSFRANYSRARAKQLANISPIIITKGDSLILLRNGVRQEVQVIPVSYHVLKAIAHIPLAIYVMLNADTETVLAAETVSQLQQYRELLVAAQKSMGDYGLSNSQLARQAQICTSSLTLLDRVVSEHKVKATELRAFTQELGPLVLTNADEAAQTELDQIHKQVLIWREQLSAAEWQNLHVVIMAPHMPRDGELTAQYFARLLSEKSEGDRLIYAEGLWDEQPALNLLATHLLDGGAAAAFFNDPQRLHRDLLADAAKAYIAKLIF